MAEKIWHLKRSDLFEQLSADELAQLEARARVRRFARKSLIYLPQDAADSLLLLADGRVKICNFTADGKQAVFTLIEPGEVFGELAAVDDGQREEYAEAIDDSKVILIPRDEIQRLMQSHPHVTLGISRLLGLRRRLLQRRLSHLMFRSNRERLILLLLELAERYGATTSEGVRLNLKLSHQDLASLIGSTRESVTVALGELQAAGLIRHTRRQIVLLDVDRMAREVQGAPPGRPASLGSPPLARRPTT